MKILLRVAVVGVFVFGVGLLNAATENPPSDIQEPLLTPVSAGTAAQTKQVGAPASEPSEKEMLLAISKKLEQLEQRISNVEYEQRKQFAALRNGVQQTFTSVGEEIGSMQGSIAELKKAVRSAASAATPKSSTP